MAVKLEFGVFEAIRVDFGVVFKVELNKDCRVSNIFDFDFLLLYIIKRYTEVELQLVDGELLSFYKVMLGLLNNFERFFVSLR